MIITNLTATIAVKRLNVRSGPGMKHAALGSIRQGIVVPLDMGRLPVVADGYEWYSLSFVWGVAHVNEQALDFWIAVHREDRRQRLAWLDIEVRLTRPPYEGQGKTITLTLDEMLHDEPLLETIQVEDCVHWIVRNNDSQDFVAAWDVGSVDYIQFED